MNASVALVMAEAGAAINATFKDHDMGKVSDASGRCVAGVATVRPKGPFDYIVSKEDLSKGQRIGNYTIEFRRVNSSEWETLVPPVLPRNHSSGVGDRPDGHDPRDQYVGHKRIDVPIVPTSGPAAIDIDAVRFTCLRVIRHPALTPVSFVHLASFSLHERRVPWD